MQRLMMVTAVCFFAAVVGSFFGQAVLGAPNNYVCPATPNTACPTGQCLQQPDGPDYVLIISNMPYTYCEAQATKTCYEHQELCSADLYLDAACTMPAGGGIYQYPVLGDRPRISRYSPLGVLSSLYCFLLRPLNLPPRRTGAARF